VCERDQCRHGLQRSQLNRVHHVAIMDRVLMRGLLVVSWNLNVYKLSNMDSSTCRNSTRGFFLWSLQMQYIAD
jgi:hypothetical protein